MSFESLPKAKVVFTLVPLPDQSHILSAGNPKDLTSFLLAVISFTQDKTGSMDRITYR